MNTVCFHGLLGGASFLGLPTVLVQHEKGIANASDAAPNEQNNQCKLL